MGQEVKIGVDGDSRGAEAAVKKVGDAAAQAASQVLKVEQAANKAAAALDKVERAARSVKATQADLSRDLGRPVSESDAAKFEDNFERMKRGRGIGSQRLRGFNSVDDWYKGHSQSFVNAAAAAAHRRRTIAMGMQGTEYADRYGAPPPGGGGGMPPSGSGAMGRIGGSAMGFARGMLALAGISSVMSMAGKAADLGTEESTGIDILKRRMGDLGVNFDRLRDQARGAGDGLGIAYVEASKLAQQFAREAGNLRADDLNGRSFQGQLATGMGLARAYGLDPSEGVGFFGTARRTGAAGDAQSDRRLALMIADAIEKGGYTGKADEVLAAVAGFANTAARMSLVAPNLGAYTGALSSLMGTGYPGLDPSGAASLLGTADSSFRRGGARGDSSKNFEFMALMHGNPGLSPFATQGLMEAGLFGTTRGVFGSGPLRGWYGGQLNDTTNFQRMRNLVNRMGGNGQMRAANFSGALGLPMGQGAALYGMSDAEVANSRSLIARAGIDPAGVKPDSLASIARIANGGIGDLRTVYGSLMSRGDVSAGDKASLTGALEKGDVDNLRQTLAQVAARYSQETDVGKETRDAAVAIKDALTQAGQPLLSVLNPMRSFLDMIARAVNPQAYQQQQKIAEDARVNYQARAMGDGYSPARLMHWRELDIKRYEAARKAAGGQLDIDKFMPHAAMGMDIMGLGPREAKAQYDQAEARRQMLDAYIAAKNAPGAPQTGTDAAWGRMGGGGGAFVSGPFVKRYSSDRVARLAALVNRPSPYDSIFMAAGARYGVDWRELKMKAAIESGFNPHLQGPQTRYGRAQGMMQVVGMHGNWEDPTTNIMAGAERYAQAVIAGHGNKAMTDQFYYAGSTRHMGPNTRAYAGNTGLVRDAMGGAPLPLDAGGGAGGAHDVRIHVTADPLTLHDAHGAPRGVAVLKTTATAKPAGTR